MYRTLSSLALAAVFAASPSFADRLDGFADMHTHPMSHLGFGGMVMYGAPDIDTPMLPSQKYRGFDLFQPECNPTVETSGSLQGALGDCNALHGAPGLDNDCGDIIRSAIVDKIEEHYVFESPNPGLGWKVNQHPRAGAPAFAHWPHWSSVTHQQMYWEWIRRAWAGGQRVMVALAVNNTLLAKAGNASMLVDDRSSVDAQLDEMTRFVTNHGDFMEIARSATDLRRIVKAGKLAVVLGVETDDFGNLSRRRANGETIGLAQVTAELHRLHARGVRYILPIHFSNTVLGGYAINRDLFALSSKEYTDAFPSPRQSCGEGIHFELKKVAFEDAEAALLRTRDLGRIIDAQPDYTPPAPGCGHANTVALNTLGHQALQEMMNLGMLIDIDHMSRRAADEALADARLRNYPLNSGHNGLLDPACLTGTATDPQRCTENARTRAQYESIRATRGMVGMGHGGTSTNFVRSYRALLPLLGNRAIAIGTDANGLEPLPAPDPLAPVTYNTTFPRYAFAGTTFDYNTIGFAHYGMFPDFLRSLQSASASTNRMSGGEMSRFMSSAEQFARTWERAELRASGAPRTAAFSFGTTWCSHAGATSYTGDFNGDGAQDLLCQDDTRIWIDYANNRGELGGVTDWWGNVALCRGAGQTVMFGDFNGDQRADFLCKSSSGVAIMYADQNGRFDGSYDHSASWCTGAASLLLGDFNGDGRTDLLCRGSVHQLNLADNDGRFGSTDLLSSFCTGANTLSVADVDGDGREDLLCRSSTQLQVDYASETGSFTGANYTLPSTFCTHTGARPAFVDVNGDGRADWVCRAPGYMWVDYASADGRYGAPDWERALTFCTMSTDTFSFADVNGDGREDMLCRNSSNSVRYAQSTGTF